MTVRVTLNLRMDLDVCLSEEGMQLISSSVSRKSPALNVALCTCMHRRNAAIARIRLGKYRKTYMYSSKRSEPYHELCCKFDATKKHSGAVSPSNAHPTSICVLAG